ncbi:MAG: IS1595 family transposase [Shinella sp.]|uniref:IS1595 family transposase n=1 Tax=Shinella sp. TaxID=1870904 RepID=UPI0040360E32
MDRARRKSRLLPVVQQASIVRFVAGVPARTAADLVGVNRNTAILFFHQLREVIVENLARQAPFLEGEIEVDESYFGGARKGKRGRGAAGKVPVFGLLKRGGRVHAVMIPDAKARALLGSIRERIRPDSIVFTDSLSSHDALDISEFHHERINHSEAFASDRNHINGIENFWSQAKRHLRHYNGIPKVHFHPFLKECEWRFNHRPASNLLRMFNEWVKI